MKINNVDKTSFLLLFLTIFIPFGLGHFISYLYRTINVVIYKDLAIELNLNADTLGLLTGVYFLTFAAAQIPLGILLDRYGPRIVQSPMLLITALGSLIFAFSNTEFGLLIGRCLIGLGVAGSLMSAIKACSIWLPIERLPLSTACLLSVGGLGALAASSPTHWILQWIDWRQLFILLSILTIIISTVIFLTVNNAYTPKETQTKELIKAVGKLYSSKIFWKLTVYSVFSHAIYMAVLALWMGPWLHDVAKFNVSDMAKALMYGTIAMVIGSLFFGWVTDYFRKYRVQPIFICGIGIILFVVVQISMIFSNILSPWIIPILFSFFGTSTTMNYAIVAQSVEPSLAGRVSSSFNLVVFILAFFIQWFFGLIISSWDNVNDMYPVIAYQWAIGFFVLLQIPGIILWFSFRPWKLS